MKKIGVIGLGSIGMRHATNLHNLGHTVFGYDPDKKAAATLEKMWAARTAMTGSSPDVDEIIESADAVVIASPTSMHSQHIQMALKANKPIFCEKPICEKDMPEAAKVVMVGYNLRFHPCVIQAKQWIDDGFIGQPVWANFVCAQYNDKEDYRRDGVILNWSHEIDLALHLLGSGFVKAASSNMNESIADITLIHPSMCQATIHLDYLTLPFVRQTIVVGDHATIIMDLLARHAWLRSTTGQVVDQFVGHGSWDDDYKDEMETFLARIDGQETVGCTGAEGLDALRVCLDAKRLSVLN